jgi:hypothetical protein
MNVHIFGTGGVYLGTIPANKTYARQIRADQIIVQLLKHKRSSCENNRCV